MKGHLALALVLGLGFSTTALAQNKAAQGEKVYTDQKCNLCHSVGDKGNKKGPLDKVAAKLSEADLRAWLTDAKGMTAKSGSTRKPEMKAYTLSKDDLDNLVAYLQTLK